MNGKMLKLMAKDAQDVQVLAAVLQDAVAPVCDMTYRTDEKAFVMVVQRFCWDCAADKQEDEGAGEDEPPAQVYRRINSALDANGVLGVQFQGLNPNNPATMLELLTINLEDGYLQMIFAGGGRLRLKLAPEWAVRLQDFGESWPTTCLPRHVT
ncbi:MAG: DUF2948 family protein [Bdellovibrionales bacterium]